MRYPTKCEIANIAIWHDFYDKFVDRSDFEYCEMDTDSPYTAFSSNSLEEIVIHLLMDINHGLYNFCADVDIEEDNFTHWLQCCDKNNLYDTKTPEVFKTEFFLATKWQVCSKTYVINKTTPVNVRMEMKAYQLLRKARGNPQSNDQELFAKQNHLQRYIGVWFTHRFHFQTCHENLEFS